MKKCCLFLYLIIMIKFSELIEFGQPDKKQLDVLAHLYYTPLNEIRKEMNVPLFIRSCFRSFDHEILHGRSGNSQHCFADKGAVDISTTKSPNQVPDVGKMIELAGLLMKVGFTRIAYYPELQFFHCDYKSLKMKQFFISDSKSNWTNVTPEQFYAAIHD